MKLLLALAALAALASALVAIATLVYVRQGRDGVPPFDPRTHATGLAAA